MTWYIPYAIAGLFMRQTRLNLEPEERTRIMTLISQRKHWINPSPAPIHDVQHKPVEIREPNTAYGTTFTNATPNAY